MKTRNRRGLMATTLIATTLVTGGCLGTDSSPTGPSSGSEDGATASEFRSEVRIVEPRAGAALVEGESFLVMVRQQMRAGPPQARARLQYRTENGDWASAGSAFPWDRRSEEFETTAPGVDGDCEIRLIVYEQFPDDPVIASQPVRLQAVQIQVAEVATK